MVLVAVPTKINRTFSLISKDSGFCHTSILEYGSTLNWNAMAIFLIKQASLKKVFTNIDKYYLDRVTIFFFQRFCRYKYINTVINNYCHNIRTGYMQ